MRNLSKLFPSSKLKPILSSIGVLALTLFSVIVIHEMTKVEVVFADNGETKTVKTHANTVKDLLEEIGITVGTYDALSHNINDEIKDGMKIHYTTAKEVVVSIDGNDTMYYTVKDTVQQFLQENNLSFSKHDDVSFQKDDEITDGMKLSISKAFQVSINDGGKKKNVWTTGDTVKNLLAKNDIEFDTASNDKINLKLNKQVDEDTKIKIVRVKIKKNKVEETIPYQTITRNDSNLEKGEEKVIQEGEEGLLVKTIKVTKENGKIVDKEIIKEKTKKDAVDKIVAVGTKEKQQQLTTLEQTATPKQATTTSEPDSGKVFQMSASAYTASCNGCSGYTSTGINLKNNPHMKVIAVDPSIIPLGSTVWVEGYGTAIAADTGGSIVGNRVDLHFPSKSAAYGFGRKTVTVKIIN